MATRIFRTRLATASIALLACGFIASAAAQDGSLASLLGSGNGEITSAQAQEAARAQFRNLDSNHDGVISEQEFVDERMKMFQTADSNGDGVVTRAEARSLAMSRMQNHATALNH